MTITTIRRLERMCRRALYRELAPSWLGTRAALRRVIRRAVRRVIGGATRSMRRKAAWMLRVVREARFAALVAGAILAMGLSETAHAAIELSNIETGAGGFSINGEAADDISGMSVSAAGDVNGDGVADLIVGARRADPNGSKSGRSYVVFGKATATQVQLSAITAGVGGFSIDGEAPSDYSGTSVSGAGDVNGDGLDDLIIGANSADPNGMRSGRSYVVFGKATGTLVQLSDITAGTGGFAINGEAASDSSGRSVSAAGDVNGDGLADLIVGASGADPNGNLSGRSYVVFGKATGTLVQLSNVTAGSGGFVINGEAADDGSGQSVSVAGDVNGDGLADLIVGATGADPNGQNSGRSYVVFGQESGFGVQLSNVAAGTGGFAINGEAADDFSGNAVSAAGDVNGDGLADLIVGASGADPNGSYSGRSYVVFGKATGTLVQLSNITAGAGGFAIDGEAADDFSAVGVSAAGDVNGDGLADLIVGATGADPNGSSSGRSYVVFGKATGTLVQLSDVTAGIGGFAMDGEAAVGYSGESVSTAGDVNGDGLADLIVGAPSSRYSQNTQGRSYVVFSPEIAPASATYMARSRIGDGKGGSPVVRTRVGDSRVTIDFSDSDTADNGSGGASAETVVLTRSNSGITNLVASGGIANVAWELTTDRTGFTNARVTLKYLNSEIMGIGGVEAGLAIFTAPAADGPWTESVTMVDPARNEISATVTELGFFAIARGSGLTAPIELTDITAGIGGFVMNGETVGDYAGFSVSTAGDVNGDGMSDLIVGAWGANANATNSGRSYVVFGKTNGAAVQLSDVRAGSGGFAMDGRSGFDLSGYSVSAAGDVNGDGLADLIVGAFGATPFGTGGLYGKGSGRSYVVFGKASGGLVQLSRVAAGSGGFGINGDEAYDASGFSVSAAGDVNGDGLADLIVGAHFADPIASNAGRSYVVFGKADGAPVRLSNITSGLLGGFAIDGVALNDESGISVSAAGDVNGDGLADLIVGAPYAGPNGTDSGRSYVVFGKTDRTRVQLSIIAAGTGGFAIDGEAIFDRSGISVSAAGDVDGDGLADVIVGASGADPYNRTSAGRSYVVFGKPDGTPVQLSDVTAGSGGFTINGEVAGDRSGGSVSAAGDVNGDGLTDLIVGADRAPLPSAEGRSYVVFGKATGTIVELSDITANVGGFAIRGEADSDVSGSSVSAAGDVNADGLADLIVGAFRADPNLSGSGRGYVVFSRGVGTNTYVMKTLPGDGPGGFVAPVTDFGDVARVKIDFNDDDTAAAGAGGASTERVTIERSKTGIRKIVPIADVADVFWWIRTNRVGFTDAKVTLKYLDSEIAGISGTEEDLAIFTAPTRSGPWVQLASTVDLARNEISATVTGFSFFVIGNSGVAQQASAEHWIEYR